jgi:hypothetical protein
MGVVFPSTLIAGAMILKGNEWGYALVSILLIKASLLGTAIISMIYFRAQNGVEIVWKGFFLGVITLGGILIAMAFYNKIDGTVKDPDPSKYNATASGK